MLTVTDTSRWRDKHKNGRNGRLLQKVLFITNILLHRPLCEAAIFYGEHRAVAYGMFYCIIRVVKMIRSLYSLDVKNDFDRTAPSSLKDIISEQTGTDREDWPTITRQSNESSHNKNGEWKLEQ